MMNTTMKRLILMASGSFAAKHEIDISSLENGVYFICVDMQKTITFTKK